MGMILICFVAVALALAGCGSDDGDGITVIATTDVAADIARHVAGPDADVETLLPAGASPHDFGASAKDRARLEEADLVVAWGAGLEAALPLDDLPVEPLELAEGQRDPHVWMNPAHIARNLPRLTERLADADPEHADAYRRRAARYADRLTSLDREIRRTLANVPPERRKLVTSHDSLGHFARRYRLEFVGAPFGVAPDSAPSAEAVADLIERVERERVPAVFAEDTDDPEVLEEIAREADVAVVDDLLVEGFGDRVEGYEEMLRFDAGGSQRRSRGELDPDRRGADRPLRGGGRPRRGGRVHPPRRHRRRAGPERVGQEHPVLRRRRAGRAGRRAGRGEHGPDRLPAPADRDRADVPGHGRGRRADGALGRPEAATPAEDARPRARRQRDAGARGRAPGAAPGGGAVGRPAPAGAPRAGRRAGCGAAAPRRAVHGRRQPDRGDRQVA